MKNTLLIAMFSIVLSVAFTASAQDTEPRPAPPAPPADIPSGPNSVGIRFWLYRIQGDISGDMSLTENLWEGIDSKNTSAKQGPFSFFTLAKLTIAGVKLQADQSGWKWDEKDEPLSGSRVERITAPQIRLDMPNEFYIQVGSDVPLQYFRKRPDGLFELGQVNQSTGLKVTSRVEKGKGNADTVVLRDFSIETSLVEKRKPVEGVALDVGEPVLRVNERRFTIAVKPNLDYGILFSTEGVGSLLLRLRLDTASK